MGTTNEYLRENIESYCEEGMKIISIIKKLTILEDTDLPISQIEVCSVIKESMDRIKANFTDKDLNVELISQDNRVYVHGNQLLLDVFENILISSIKYNEKTEIDIKILVFKKHIDNKSYVQIEIVDNEPAISDLAKDKILEGRKGQQDKSKGLLLRFLLVERILDSIKGRIWVKDNNFVLQIPSTEYFV